MNEDGRAAGKEQGEVHQLVPHEMSHASKKPGENMQRTFNLTWIQPNKQHVEEDSEQKDSP